MFGPAAVGARVCRFKAPDLEDGARASKNEAIQCEVEALRKMRRVDCGSKAIVNTVAFGGSGPANVPVEQRGPGAVLSLYTLGVMERVRRERTGGSEEQ